MTPTENRTRKIPDGYNTLQPYLIFVDCKQAMAFYTRAFGATEKLVMRHDKDRIVHAEWALGNCVLMMAEEHPEIEAYAPAHYGGSPVSLMMYVDDCDASYAVAIAAGATGFREPTDQPYGDRMAGILDPFGYKWFLAHSLAAESKPQ
jgi:PhnB protein